MATKGISGEEEPASGRTVVGIAASCTLRERVTGDMVMRGGGQRYAGYEGRWKGKCTTISIAEKMIELFGGCKKANEVEEI